MRPTVFVENLGRLLAQPIAVIVVSAAGLGPTALVFAWTVPYALALVVNVVWVKALLRKVGSRDTALLLPRAVLGPLRGIVSSASSSGTTPPRVPSRPWSRPRSGVPTS